MRKKVIPLRVTEQEYARLEKLADRQYKTVLNYIRAKLGLEELTPGQRSDLDEDRRRNQW